MKGDYSQPGLMPGRYYLEQIDLPSAYLVYAIRRRLRRKLQLTPAADRFASLIPIGRSLGIFSRNYSYLLKAARFGIVEPPKKQLAVTCDTGNAHLRVLRCVGIQVGEAPR
jgi:hypothetical protein